MRGGTKIGEINVPENAKQVKTKFSTPVPAVDGIGKKHAIYLKVRGGSGNLCDILGISFSKQEVMLDDDFSGSFNGQNWILDGTAEISDNLLKLSATNDYASAVAKQGQDWRNYEVISDVNLKSGDLAITFMQNGGDYYELRMMDREYLELTSFVNGVLFKSLGYAQTGTFTTGESAKVGINTNNGIISVRIDGILVFQVKNDDHDNGGVGFHALGTGASAEIGSVLVRASTEKEVALTTVNIEVDGKPLDVANLSPTNYTVNNGIYDYENYETYYPVPLTQKTAPVVTASCDDKDVKISV